MPSQTGPFHMAHSAATANALAAVGAPSRVPRLKSKKTDFTLRSDKIPHQKLEPGEETHGALHFLKLFCQRPFSHEKLKDGLEHSISRGLTSNPPP